MMKLICILVAATTVMAMEVPGEEVEISSSEAYVVKFYDISALTMSRPDFSFTGRVPASTASQKTERNVTVEDIVPGMTGGGGLGGGLFSVSPELPQSGDFEDSPSIGVALNSRAPKDSATSAEIVALVTHMVQPDTWQGDDKARCVVVGETLVVRQTAAVHKQISEFLDDLAKSVLATAPSLRLNAWWIPVASDRRPELDTLLQSKDVTASAVDDVCSRVNGFRTSLRCECFRTAHVGTGVRQPFVANSTPQVGTAATGYAAVVETLNLGILLEVTPTTLPSTTAGNSESGVGTTRFLLNLRSAVTSGAHDAIQARAAEWDIDRFQVTAQVVESPCQVTLGRPVVAGTIPGLTGRMSPDGDDPVTDLVLVVWLNREDE